MLEKVELGEESNFAAGLDTIVEDEKKVEGESQGTLINNTQPEETIVQQSPTKDYTSTDLKEFSPKRKFSEAKSGTISPRGLYIDTKKNVLKENSI